MVLTVTGAVLSRRVVEAMEWGMGITAAFLHLGRDVLVFFNAIKLLRVRLDG